MSIKTHKLYENFTKIGINVVNLCHISTLKNQNLVQLIDLRSNIYEFILKMYFVKSIFMRIIATNFLI